MMLLEAVAEHCPETDVWDMNDFPSLRYSRSQIVKVGEQLSGTITYDDREKVHELFRIAYNWRAAHLYPMRILRYELRQLATKSGSDRAIVAARLKRMVSIRKKLRKTTNTLWQIQDLGGCRAIVRNIAELNTLVGLYKGGASKHTFKRPWDYVEKPKPDGYRSIHLLYSFKPRKAGEDEFDGRQIEIQLRTRLQHAWATAVEAVGLATGQDLKGGEGNADWRRLFALMSTEIAVRENCNPVPDTPANNRQRRDELLAISKSLKAVSMLTNINVGLNAMPPKGSYKYFLIQFVKDKVSFTGFDVPSVGAADFDVAEIANPAAVLVQVDRAEDLKNAYPNYFLDVTAFTLLLRRAIGALTEEEFNARRAFVWV